MEFNPHLNKLVLTDFGLYIENEGLYIRQILEFIDKKYFSKTTPFATPPTRPLFFSESL